VTSQDITNITTIPKKPENRQVAELLTLLCSLDFSETALLEEEEDKPLNGEGYQFVAFASQGMVDIYRRFPEHLSMDVTYNINNLGNGKN